MRLLAKGKGCHATTRRAAAQARLPDDRSFRRREPGPGNGGDARGDHPRRSAGLRQRVAAVSSSAARHLVAGGDHGGGDPTDVADRTRHRRHPVGSGESVAVGRGPRHRGHPVGWADQPRRVGGHADALRPLQDRAVSGNPRPRRTSRRTACCGCCVVCVANRSATSPGPSASSSSPITSSRMSPGLADRVWYGGGRSSAVWAGEQGINYLTSSVVSTEGTESRDFATIQGEQIDAFRAHHPDPARARVSQGLVVIPTDSATDEQIRRYRDYAASRFERTKAPQGPRGMLFSPDFVGTSDELADLLHRARGIPAGRRGGVRAAVHVRRGRLPTNHLRHGRTSGTPPRMAACRRVRLRP